MNICSENRRGSGQSAGEFYARRSGDLMSYILDPKPGNEIYDPAADRRIAHQRAHLRKGRPKNFLSDENINRIANIYLEWKENVK